MRGKWKVTSNSIGGKTMYAVYRLKDVQEALVIADKLNSGASL